MLVSQKTKNRIGGLFTHHPPIQQSGKNNEGSYFSESWWAPSFTTSISNGINAHDSFAGFEGKTSPLDTLLTSLSIIDVPRDGSCLFWAAGLAYLLSISADQLEKACTKLFGTHSDMDLIKEKISEVRQDKQLTILKRDSSFILAVNSFRKQVVKHMYQTHRADAYIGGVPIKKHLTKMLNPETWGGREEIEAICDLLGCKISVISNWDKNLEYINTFGAGSPHFYLHLKDGHYAIGLQKKSVPEHSEKLTPSVVATTNSASTQSNSHVNKANLSDNSGGISWAKHLKNAFNPPSKKSTDNAKANDSASLPLRKSAAEEKKSKGSEESAINLYIGLKALRELEAAGLVEELSILEEIEELEEEIEEKSEINRLVPFQLLHPLNILTPFSRLKKFTNWLNATEPSKLSTLREEKVKKLNEMEEINKQIALLRKHIERKEKVLFSIKEKIKKPAEWIKIKEQMRELNNAMNTMIIEKNKKVDNRATKQDEKLKNLQLDLDEKREEYIAIQNSKKQNRVKRRKKKIILQKIENITNRINNNTTSPIVMLNEEIALQKAYLGLKKPIFSNARLSDETILDEDFNFLYLKNKWNERPERISYFTELPFAEGFPDEASEVTGLINKITKTISLYSNKLAKKSIELKEYFFTTFGLGVKCPGEDCSVADLGS